NANSIYVVYTDTGRNSGDRADIFFTQSNDGGITWASPTVLNSDSAGGGTADQWQPSIAVTPDGTHLFVSWYDRRNSGPGNGKIDRFGVIGSISGSTVSFGNNFQINDAGTSFPEVFGQDPIIVSNYMGDYDQATADNSFFYSSWASNINSDATFANQP